MALFPLSAMAATVFVDGGVRYQTMDGFGTSVRVFDDPHVFENFNPATGRAATVLTTAQQNEVLYRLYTELKLTRIRPASPDTGVGTGIEPVNDNSNPDLTDLSKFNFDWKRLDAHADYIARARESGADTFFLSPLSRETWMGTNAQSASDVGEYSEWLLAQVRRSAERGVRLPYLSVANEPSYSRNPLSGEFMREVIKNLGPRLRAEGFRHPVRRH
jgi:O-glycosyl hydrolase